MCKSACINNCNSEYVKYSSDGCGCSSSENCGKYTGDDYESCVSGCERGCKIGECMISCTTSCMSS